VSEEQPETPPQEEEMGEFDYMDPLKRDPEDDSIPGLDPIVPPVPPEE
jgi:hypothetical protein